MPDLTVLQGLTHGVADLFGPRRCYWVGLFKSPNRLRWLAHRVADKKLGTVPERWGREMLWGCRRRRRIRLLNRTCCANLPRRSISFSNLDVILRWWRYAYHRLMASIPPGSGARDGQVGWSLSQNAGTVPAFFLFAIGGSGTKSFFPGSWTWRTLRLCGEFGTLIDSPI